MTMITSAIYSITNTVTQKVYVGSACHFKRRWSGHLTHLRRGTHQNMKLQNAWSKYGEPAFVFAVLELVEDKSNLIAREQHWMDVLCAVAHGYNIAPRAGSPLGMKHSAETRKKVAAASRGRRHSLETRTKMSVARTGQTKAKHSEEARRKMSLAAKGRIIPAEQRQKMALAATGRVFSPASIAKRVATFAKKRAEREALCC